MRIKLIAKNNTYEFSKIVECKDKGELSKEMDAFESEVPFDNWEADSAPIDLDNEDMLVVWILTMGE